MNVNDTERMHTLLEMMNYAPTPTPENASLIIINSCSVREKPVHKVHSEVGRYRKLKEKNPKLKIGVGGCVAQQEKDKLMKDVPLIDFVFGTDAIDDLPKIVSQAKERKVVSAAFKNAEPYHIETLIRNPGVSTFVNITKGCDNFCTFCVVPFTRGRERSRPLQHLLDDVNKLVDRGVKEVTLVGQNVNSYTSDCGADFRMLLETLATQTNIQRLRFTTPHPKDFNEDLANTMQKYRHKICEYTHMPLQSGNSEILERMNRGYSREQFLEKIAMMKRVIPGVVFSTDIIVGFPGETEQQFQDTMSLMDEVDFENVYAFAYSPRPFTKASKFTDQVPEDVKSRRLNELISKHRDQAYKLSQKYVGLTLDVLIESFDEETKVLTGRSTQNKIVHFEGSKDSIGKTLKLTITEAYLQTLRGVVVG